MDEWAEVYPWSNKTSQVFWRGGCKGPRKGFVIRAQTDMQTHKSARQTDTTNESAIQRDRRTRALDGLTHRLVRVLEGQTDSQEC